MPWWSWIIIWVLLALALIGMFVVSGIRLFRKGVAVFDELEILASKLDVLDAASDAAEESRVQLAILAGSEETRRRRALVREAALDRREARHDARIARGRRITTVDASTRRWFG
jgi:hypothetical protein